MTCIFPTGVLKSTHVFVPAPSHMPIVEESCTLRPWLLFKSKVLKVLRCSLLKYTPSSGASAPFCTSGVSLRPENSQLLHAQAQPTSPPSSSRNATLDNSSPMRYSCRIHRSITFSALGARAALPIRKLRRNIISARSTSSLPLPPHPGVSGMSTVWD